MRVMAYVVAAARDSPFGDSSLSNRWRVRSRGAHPNGTPSVALQARSRGSLGSASLALGPEADS